MRYVGGDFILRNWRVRNIGRIETFSKKIAENVSNLSRTGTRYIIMIDGVRNGGFTRTRFAVTPKSFARGSIIKEITEKNLFGIFDFVT